jgi:hypothetical protein
MAGKQDANMAALALCIGAEAAPDGEQCVLQQCDVTGRLAR